MFKLKYSKWKPQSQSNNRIELPYGSPSHRDYNRNVFEGTIGDLQTVSTKLKKHLHSKNKLDKRTWDEQVYCRETLRCNGYYQAAMRILKSYCFGDGIHFKKPADPRIAKTINNLNRMVGRSKRYNSVNGLSDLLTDYIFKQQMICDGEVGIGFLQAEPKNGMLETYKTGFPITTDLRLYPSSSLFDVEFDEKNQLCRYTIKKKEEYQYKKIKREKTVFAETTSDHLYFWAFEPSAEQERGRPQLMPFAMACNELSMLMNQLLKSVKTRANVYGSITSLVDMSACDCVDEESCECPSYGNLIQNYGSVINVPVEGGFFSLAKDLESGQASEVEFFNHSSGARDFVEIFDSLRMLCNTYGGFADVVFGVTTDSNRASAAEVARLFIHTLREYRKQSSTILDGIVRTQLRREYGADTEFVKETLKNFEIDDEGNKTQTGRAKNIRCLADEVCVDWIYPTIDPLEIEDKIKGAEILSKSSNAETVAKVEQKLFAMCGLNS